MEHNIFKRRRPFGHEDAPAEPVLHRPSSFAHPRIDFSSLPYELRFHLERAASHYGFSGSRLHQLACQEQSFMNDQEYTRKKQRAESSFAMSSQFTGKAHSEELPRGLQEEPPRVRHHGHGVDEPGGSSGFQAGGLPLGFSEGFANLKVILCQNCLARCDSTDVYQPVSGSEPFHYGPSKSLVEEKTSSAHFSAPPVYVPASITAGQQAPFSVGEPVLNNHYLPGYQTLQDARPLVSQPSNRESMVYPVYPVDTVNAVDPNTPTYYDAQENTRDIPDPHIPLPAAYSQAQGHLVGSSALAVSYSSGELITLAGSPKSNPLGSLPAETATGSSLAPNLGPHDMGSHGEAAKMQDSVSNLVVVAPGQPHRPAAAKRGPFTDSTKREETAQTRRIGSCVRCRMQRIRCKVNPADEHGPCLTCTEKVSPKVWRVPCLRVKITDVKLFKPGQVLGYEWTQRWKDSIVDNIANWASTEVKTIYVSEGYTKRAVELRVRRFVPQAGDRLERSWVHNGVKKSVPIPPYAIVDLDEAQRAYETYINDGMAECFSSVLGPKDSLVWRTYYVAWRMAQDPKVPPNERNLLSLTLRLWMAVRLTTQSAIIIGEETLGMSHDIMDETSPLHGRIPLPPVMGAQLDMVLIHHIQMKLRRDLLEELQKMTQKSKQQTWLTTYLVTFILLHNSALITKHDAGYARKHGIQRRFAREDDVQEYHLGANILLAYFHYCNKGIYPFSDECRDQDLRALAELDDRKVRFVRYTRSYASNHKREWADLQRRKAYEDDYFFVSQMFEENWQPQTTM